MISQITGKIIKISDKSLTVDVSGVGYEINTNALVLEKAKVGELKTFFTFLYVREDIMELFGFQEANELSFFKKLISVSGVGPKSALTIMSLASVSELQQGIRQGDASLLTKVSGIGKKTAERLIVELKNKIDLGDLTDDESGHLGVNDGQVIDGLVALGYTTREAREAAKLVDKDIDSVKDRVKAALKSMGQGQTD